MRVSRSSRLRSDYNGLKTRVSTNHDGDHGQRRGANYRSRADDPGSHRAIGVGPGARGGGIGPPDRQAAVLAGNGFAHGCAARDRPVCGWRIGRTAPDPEGTPVAARIGASRLRPEPRPRERPCLSLHEAADGARLVFVNIEDGVELRDLEQVLDPLVEVEQLQCAAAIGYRGESGYQLTDPRAVDLDRKSTRLNSS